MIIVIFYYLFSLFFMLTFNIIESKMICTTSEWVQGGKYYLFYNFRKNTPLEKSENERDELLKTVVFTEGLNEAYSDTEHINKWYKSIHTEEVKNPSSQVFENS